MEAAFTVKAVRAREGVDLAEGSTAEYEDSDSGDSEFSLDDHHRPWAVTEKLLLHENSDIELVQSRGFSTVSLWPPPKTAAIRQTGSLGLRGPSTTSSSLYSVILPTPAPHTVFAAQKIAEDEKEYKRMKNMLMTLKYRKLPRNESFITSNGSHTVGTGLNQYASSVRNIAVKKLPYNRIGAKVFKIGDTMSKGSGMTLLPRTRLGKSSRRKLRSRVVSAPTVSMSRINYTLRKRNVLIKPLAIDVLNASNSEIPSNAIDERNEESTKTKSRPRTAPLRRKEKSPVRKRPATARIATKEDDTVSIGRIFEASTEIKQGLLRLSAGRIKPISYSLGSPISSFNSLPSDNKASLDRYGNPSEVSVRSPLPGLKPWAPEGERLKTPISRSSNKRKGTPVRTPIRSVTTPTKSRFKSPVRTPSKTPVNTTRPPKSPLRTKSRPSTNSSKPASSSKSATPISTPTNKKNEKNNPTKTSKSAGSSKKAPIIKSIAQSQEKQTSHRVGNTPDVSSAGPWNSAESHSVTAAAGAKSDLVTLDEPNSAGLLKTEASMSISLEKTLEGPEGSEGPVSQGSASQTISLYNTTTGGSKHCLFDQSGVKITAATHHEVIITEQRDATIMLTSPQKLPKSLMHRPRDALFIPQNQLMENRKAKRRETAIHESKMVPDVVAQGAQFTHQKKILSERAKNERKMREMERKKEKKRIKKIKRARRKLAEKSTAKERRRDILSLGTNSSTSRPGTATSRTTTTTATSGRPTTAGSSHQVKTMPPTKRPPPPGWQEHLDPVSGDTFYVHLKSQRTTWDYPEKGRSIPSRGLASGEKVQMSQKPKRTIVKQDWTEYLPEPKLNKFSW